MYQAAPNPANASPVSIAYQGEKLFGSKTQHVGQYNSTLSTQEASMAKAVQAYTEAGWKFVDCPFEVNYNGEANYTPFVQKLQTCGAEIVFDDATPGPTLYGALEAANQIGYDPVWLLDAAEYTEAFAQWNTSGLGNNVYVRIGFEPLEAAKVVPAVAQYLSIVKKSGGLTSALGEQATSSFFLWATEAKACGSTLTRQCMINHLSKVTSWTGGGLNAPSDPAKNRPPPCGILMKLDGTKWVQYYPKKLGSCTWPVTSGPSPGRTSLPMRWLSGGWRAGLRGGWPRCATDCRRRPPSSRAGCCPLRNLPAADLPRRRNTHGRTAPTPAGAFPATAISKPR